MIGERAWRRVRSYFRRKSSPLEVYLYGRAACHLCETAAGVLQRIAKKVPLVVRYVDLDGEDCSSVTRAAYADRIPVITNAQGEVLGEGKISEYRLLPRLRKIAQGR